MFFDRTHIYIKRHALNIDDQLKFHQGAMRRCSDLRELLVSPTDDLTDELTSSGGGVIFEMEVGMFRR